MVQQSKVYEVENVAENIKGAKSVALIDYQGLNAQQNTELRQKVRDTGGTMAVVKNTLIKRALAKLGIELKEPLTGPTALVYANEDVVAPLKAVKEVSDEFDKPQFKFGVFQQKRLSLEKLNKLVNIPGKDVLLSKVANGLYSPMVKLASGLKSNQRKLALLLKSLAKQKESQA